MMIAGVVPDGVDDPSTNILAPEGVVERYTLPVGPDGGVVVVGEVVGTVVAGVVGCVVGSVVGWVVTPVVTDVVGSVVGIVVSVVVVVGWVVGCVVTAVVTVVVTVVVGVGVGVGVPVTCRDPDPPFAKPSWLPFRAHCSAALSTVIETVPGCSPCTVIVARTRLDVAGINELVERVCSLKFIAPAGNVEL